MPRMVLLVALAIGMIPTLAHANQGGWLGVALQMSRGSGGIAPQRHARVEIEHVFAGSPAQRAGLRKGDAIIAIDGTSMKNVRHVILSIGGLPPQGSVRLQILRGKVLKTIQLKLGSRPSPETLLKKAWMNRTFPESATFIHHRSGKSVSVRSLRGAPAIIKVWSTTCGPCTLARPHLKALKRSFRREKLSVVGISLEKAETIDAYLKRRPIKAHTLWRDPQLHLAKTLRVSSRPTFFYLDPKGVIRGIHVGLTPRRHMAAMLRQIIPQKPSAKERSR